MPGVPSGRGCEACRKQKKKCDLGRPACSRCTRLSIACSGGGERRYKFKNETFALRSKKATKRSAVTRKVAVSTASSSTVRSLSPPPSNVTTALAKAFISTIEVSDLRFSVSYYGSFLRHVPGRLGTNEALDASVAAFASTFTAVHTRQRSPDMFVQYGNALRALRVCLDDPIKSQTPETLCAIYFTVISQSWIGSPGDQCANHGQVLAHILNAAAFRHGRDPFEDELVFALVIPVLLWSMVNPNLRLNAWLLKQADTYGPPRPITIPKPGEEETSPISTLTLSSLAKIPDFVRHPEVHLFDIQLTYEQQRIDISTLRRRLAKTPELPPPHEVGAFLPPVSPNTVAYLYHTAYVLLLALALILNGILRALDVPDDMLVQESETFSEEVIVLGERLSQYRPLGAGYIPLCGAAAWAGTADPCKQSRAEEMILDYQTDFAGARWMDGAVWLKRRSEALRLKTLAARIEQDGFSASGLNDASMVPNELAKSCCVQ